LLVGLAFLGALSAHDASADDKDQKRYLYQWTDERGSVHISDSLEKVPAKYRAKASRMEQGLAGGEGVPQAEEPVREAPGGFSLSDDAASQDEETLKMEWQQRMYDARQRMAEAEQRLERGTERLKALQEKAGYGLYGYTPEAAAEAARLEEEISRAQIDLDHARNEVENVIPEQARKAGIPPGWLREVR
jgi:hypothetical protein